MLALLNDEKREGFPLKQMFLSTGKEFKEIETFEPGANYAEPFPRRSHEGRRTV